MMRKLRAVICLLLCVVLILLCGGCFVERFFAPKSADALWNRINQTMDTLKSYKMEGTMEAVLYEQELRFDVKGTVYGVSARLDKKPYYFVRSTSTLACEDYSFQQKQESIEAYYNGKAYLLNQQGTTSRKLCSEISYEEFEEMFLEGDFALSGVDLMDCTQIEYDENEDGTWSLNLSGYTKENLDAFLLATGMTDLSASEYVLDMQISILADASFRVQSMDYKMSFDRKAGLGTVLKLNCAYSAYNEAEANPDAIKVEQYTQVKNLHILKETTDQLKEIQAADSGEATLTINQTLQYNKQEQALYERDQISFGHKNGNLYYTVDVDYNGVDARISYENEKQTITANGKEELTTKTEREANKFLSGLLNAAYYNEAAISNIQEVKPGRYELTFAYSNIPGIETVFTSNGGTLSYTNQIVTVTFKDGKLVRMISDVSAAGYIGKVWTTLTLESVITYQSAGNETI